MLTVIRTDAATHIGSGHVMRCLALADALRARGTRVAFVCREHEGHLCDLIEARGFPVSRMANDGGAPVAVGAPSYAGWLRTPWREDAAQTRAAVLAMDAKTDWLIVDHYAIDGEWEGELRSAVEKVMVIDDLADRVHDCDLLLDQNLFADMHLRYRHKVPETCKLLLGPQFALLALGYAHIRRAVQARSGPIRNILIFFGGVDSANLTSRALAAVLRLNRPDILVDVVLGKNNAQVREVRQRIQGHSNIQLHHDVPSLAPLMAKADLALGAGGTANWERLCMGLPTLVVTLSENQRVTTDELSRLGLVKWLGHRDEVSESDWVDALEAQVKQGVEKAWSLKCIAAVDGNGASRVCSEIMKS